MQLKKGVRDAQRGAQYWGKTMSSRPLDPESFEEPGWLGFPGDGFLNSLGLTAWDSPSHPFPAVPLPPHHLPRQRWGEHLSLREGRASPETQGHGPPCRLQLTLFCSCSMDLGPRLPLQAPTKHQGCGRRVPDITSLNTDQSPSSQPTTH